MRRGIIVAVLCTLIASAVLAVVSFALAATRGVTKPTAITSAADTPAVAYVIFRGEIATGGGEAAMWFEYGLTEALGTKTAQERLRISTTTVPVSAGVAVEGGRTYFYRVVVKNEVGTVPGEVMQVTATSPPSLKVTPEAATIHVGSRKQFRAVYDADGAGPGGTVDVTDHTTWVSANVQTASHELGGTFLGRAVGKTIVRGLYNANGPVISLSDVRNVAGSAELTVDAAPASSAGGDGAEGFGGLGAIPFAVLIGILITLVFAAAGVSVWHYTKRFRG
ncbi:MAG: hypothetical protein RL681_482 [Candidatus Parcubacteria bacterium]|jgi:hypothetical protein